MKTRATCFYCENRWGACQCSFQGSFEHSGTTITDPSVDDSGRFFVDPTTYYGCNYIKAWVEGAIKKVGINVA